MRGYERLNGCLIQGPFVDSLYDALPVDEEGARNTSDEIGPRRLAPLIEEDGEGQTLAVDVGLDLVASLSDVNGQDDQIAVTIVLIAGLES